MRAYHQLATVEKLLASYKENEPLHRFLVQFYKQNKQMGSKDRKTASRLIYNYYRLGVALITEKLEVRLAVAEFLCNTDYNAFVSYYQPEWEDKIQLPLLEKLEIVAQKFSNFNLEDVFPFHSHLSVGIDKKSFLESHFVQPDLFVRIKKSAEKSFLREIEHAEVCYQQLSENTFSFPNGTKLDQIVTNKGSYEVQDLSSQKVGEYFKPNKWDKWWDCCAASGGKSLLLLDREPSVKLLVSDIRESILENLDLRFRAAGIKNYQKKILDLTQNPALFLHDYSFDGIILDAPCSGSGTWGRTPEMISQFKEHGIKFFQDLQRKIAKNVIPYLSQNKPIIYITCSVFKEENEEQVAWLLKEFDLKLEEQTLIEGYYNKADSMFVARLIKKAE